MKQDNENLLIAPCGMNCSVCRAYLRKKNKCSGCRVTDIGKPITRTTCKIKTCDVLETNNSSYCFECEKFPCGEIKRLDKRYCTKYNMSMIENLENIKKFGVEKFIESEKARWTCPECGGTICVHIGKCSSCGNALKVK